MATENYYVIVNYAAESAYVTTAATKPEYREGAVAKGPVSSREASEREIERIGRVEKWK